MWDGAVFVLVQHVSLNMTPSSFMSFCFKAIITPTPTPDITFLRNWILHWPFYLLLASCFLLRFLSVISSLCYVVSVPFWNLYLFFLLGVCCAFWVGKLLFMTIWKLLAIISLTVFLALLFLVFLGFTLCTCWCARYCPTSSWRPVNFPPCFFSVYFQWAYFCWLIFKFTGFFLFSSPAFV